MARYAEGVNVPPSPLYSAPVGQQQHQPRYSDPYSTAGPYHPPPLSNPPSFSSDSHDLPSSLNTNLPRYSSPTSSSPLNPTGPRPPPKQSDPRMMSQNHPLSHSYYADSPTATLRGDSTDDLNRKGEKAGFGNPNQLNYNRSDSAFKRMSGAFVNGKKVPSDDTDPAATSYVRKQRLGYLDGLKWVAAMIVLNGTLFDAAVPNGAYSWIQRSSPLYVLRDTNLGIMMLIMLSARSILEPLWDVPAPGATKDGGKGPKEASIAWYKVARAMLVRPFRFLLPILVIAALQWGLNATGKTHNCNAVGMNEPYWREIKSFAGYATLTFDMFTWFELDTVAGKTFGANLWFTPWLFQSSYCAYVVHIMLGNLSSNRYWIYFALFFFSWTSFNFFAVAIVGVFIADMVAHGHIARIQKLPFLVRLALQLAVLGLGCVMVWVGPIRSNLNSGMATINVTEHTEIEFANIIFLGCVLLVVETSKWTQAVLGNIVARLLGKLSAGIVLIAPSITFTLVPDLALSMHKSGSSQATILGISYIILLLASSGLAIPFYFLVEMPSNKAGVFFANFVQQFGVKDGTRSAIKQANAVLHKKVKAPSKLSRK